MSRPRPLRLLSRPMADGIHTIEIAEVPEQWTITYKGQLVSVIKQHILGKPKYLRTTFQTQAPADNLAAKLNTLFETQDFGVTVLAAEPQGEQQVPQTKRQGQGGGRFYQNIGKATTKNTEVLPGGHVVYRDRDGTEQIRINSRAWPTDNIRKGLKKNTDPK